MGSSLMQMREQNESVKNALTPNDFMLLFCSDGAEFPAMKEMISMAKRKFVNKRHNKAISQLVNVSGFKKGKWKTYIEIDGKRKEILRKTEEELYESLYQHYLELEDKPKTLKDIFIQLIDYKLNCLGRTMATIRNDKQLFRYVSDDLQKKPIAEISDDDIKKWLVADYMRTKPTESRMKKLLQVLAQTFEYAIRQHICYDNPMKYISSTDYVSKCNLHRKRNEEKEFSESELKAIREASQKQLDNPRALMRLFSMETGLRIGELCAVHKDDIKDGFIHVHRQQIKDWDRSGRQSFYEVPYTKDEKRHPHDGRYVPITPEAQSIIDQAMMLPGTSPYLFHSNGEPVTKDSYAQNLKFFCRRIGLTTTNNHAFRMAFNSRLIELDFSASDRALILGHQVQTNETHYSLTDKRRLEGIKERLA